MPTYQYKCKECEHEFEVFQSMKDDAIENCEKCQGKVRKIFSSTGIIFKGSGFYVNDYKNSSNGIKSTPANGDKCAAAGSTSGCNSCAAAE